MVRSAELAAFLEESAIALRAATRLDAAAAAAAERVIDLWSTSTGSSQPQAGEALPVCRWIQPALGIAAQDARANLAAAFARVQPGLKWRRRQTSQPADGAFWDGHANAMILGPGGLEDRADLWVGATVMAPGITYADHDHPPEEIYLSLAPGEWWNAGMDWTDPGPSGAIYNPPGILHKMRSGKDPFLALWFLPI